MGSDEPVWITGIGAATPLGCDLSAIESRLLAGRSGVTRVTRFPTDDYPSRIAAQIGPVPTPTDCDPLAFAALNPLEQVAQHGLHLGAGEGVEGAEGLVHEEEVGVGGEGAGEADALALAAGELPGIAGAEFGEVEAGEGEDFLDAVLRV